MPAGPGLIRACTTEVPLTPGSALGSGETRPSEGRLFQCVFKPNRLTGRGGVDDMVFLSGPKSNLFLS